MKKRDWAEMASRIGSIGKITANLKELKGLLPICQI